MNAFDLNPALKWLFVFTHPDDELAIAGWMSRLAQNHVAVHAVWVVSNDERRAESIRACELIGLTEAQTIFLNYPDGAVCDRLNALADDLKRVYQPLQPDRIVCAAFEQGHLDHDSVHVACRALGAEAVFEFPEYSPYSPWAKRIHQFSTAPPGETYALNDADRALKRKVLACFESQSLPRLLQWEGVRLALKGEPNELLSIERLRPAQTYDFRSPVKPDEILTSRKHAKTWQRWLAAYDRYEASLTSPYSP